ncbi:unnamed protein product [Effrenium voratum]|uniref:Elongation factor Ts, mitochondrial n=1 Tax=Effrenium voratum TaxID=2562239 RepID=A0AA36HU69_9DINO|nr:unnamed protein product [Effrenium voratum]
MDAAMEWLKKKGMAKADKKAGNVAVEGCVASYVHFNNKIAVLVEVNSETDFVANNEIFKQFASDVAMQVAANDEVVCLTTDDVPEDVKQKEKETEMAKDEDLAGKPDNIKEKIVAGRLSKKFESKALMNQTWLKDEDISVQEAVKQIIAKLGENIVVRRFERLTLGEGLEKKETTTLRRASRRSWPSTRLKARQRLRSPRRKRRRKRRKRRREGGEEGGEGVGGRRPRSARPFRRWHLGCQEGAHRVRG